VSQVGPSALQQHGGQVAFGVGLGLQVGFGLQVGMDGCAQSRMVGCRSARIQQGLGAQGAGGPVSTTQKHQTAELAGWVRPRGLAGHGVVAVAAAELVKHHLAARWGQRDLHLHEQFIRGQRGLVQALEKVGGGHLARALQ